MTYVNSVKRTHSLSALSLLARLGHHLILSMFSRLTSLVEGLDDLLGAVQSAHKAPEHLLLLHGGAWATFTCRTYESLVLDLHELEGIQELSFFVG